MPDLLELSGKGIANILIFRHQATSQLKILETEYGSDTDSSITKLAKKIVDECSEIKRDISVFHK